MTKLLRTLCSAALLALHPVQSNAQTADQMRMSAEQALSAGEPARALLLTQRLLAQDADDFAALFLQSLALTDLGRFDEAATAAAHAYRASQNDEEWLQSARLAGAARFKLGQFSRAQWWLRRAANHAKTDEEITTVRKEFQNIRARNPLSAKFSFSIAPSNNINNGADQDFFMLEGLDIEFVIPASGQALSGIEYAGDVQLSYRLSQSPVQITSVDAYFFGRTFTLSSSSKATVPGLSGSDFALTLAEVSINHRRLLFDGLGPTTFSAHLGNVRFSGDPLWTYQKLSLAQDFPLGRPGLLTLQAAVQDQNSQNPIQPDTTVYDLLGIYTPRLQTRDRLRLSLGARLNDTAFEENTFTDYRIALDYGFAEPLFNARWTLSAELGHINYDEFELSLDGRRDTYVELGGSAVFEGVSYFGFSPSISVSATHTNSNVTQFANSQVQGRLGIQSNF